MSSLIANKVKTNICLVSINLISILSALSYVPQFKLLPRIQQQFICSLYFFTLMFATLLTQLFTCCFWIKLVSLIYIAEIFKPRLRLHTRLTELLLTIAWFVLRFHMRTPLVWRKLSKQNVCVPDFLRTI